MVVLVLMLDLAAHSAVGATGKLMRGFPGVPVVLELVLAARPALAGQGACPALSASHEVLLVIWQSAADAAVELLVKLWNEHGGSVELLLLV